MNRTLERKIDTIRVTITLLSVPSSDVTSWLKGEMRRLELPHMLAHADDGIVWGRLSSGAVITSHEALQNTIHAGVSPSLRDLTLQQARAFGNKAELMVWRTGRNGFKARLIEDHETADTSVSNISTVLEGAVLEYLDETQMLWGDHIVRDGGWESHGFTLWREGQQGMLHALPCSPVIDRKIQMPQDLCVRHYLANEPTARIALSRLTGFSDQSDNSLTDLLDSDLAEHEEM